MGKIGFVAIIENAGNYKIALGYSGTWIETQFIVIEYTDSGENIHFYDSSNKLLKDKYETFKNTGTVENGPYHYFEFSGNDKLKDLLQLFQEQGDDFQHKLNCSCPACGYCKFTIYRGDTIDRILADFSIIK